MYGENNSNSKGKLLNFVEICSMRGNKSMSKWKNRLKQMYMEKNPPKSYKENFFIGEELNS